MITPRKRRIVEALKPHLRYGPKTALVDAVDVLLEEVEQGEREACARLILARRPDDPLRQRSEAWLRDDMADAIRARGQGQAEAAE